MHERLVLYKRLANCASADEIDRMVEELVDRFGPLPEATRNLFRMTALRLRAEPLSIRRLDASSVGGFVEFGPRTTLSPAWIVTRVRTDPMTYRLDRQQKFRFSAELEDPQERFAFVETLIGEMLANQETREAPSKATAVGQRQR